MVKFRNAFPKLLYALTLVWLCIKSSEATLSLDFDQIKQNIFSANKVSYGYKLTENDLKCLKEFKSIEAGLNTYDEWALKLLDSWGRLPSGIFSGHIIDFGSFPQCFEIERQDKIYETKYCLGSLGLGPQIRNEKEPNHRISYPRSKTGMSIIFGMCVPAVCSMDLLQNLVDESKLTDPNVMSIDFLEASCQVAGEPSGFTRLDYITTVILVTVLVLIMMSTAYDLYCRQFDRKSSEILLSFSLYTNGQKLLSCKRSNSPDQMGCLNGMRAISTQWIVLGHTLMVYFHSPLRNLLVHKSFLARPVNTYILNSFMGVDTFLFIGGLVLSFNMLKKLSETNGKINIPMLYFHRYLRLTPIFAMMVLIIASILRYLGSGPIWPSLMESEVKTCQKWWWSSMLYVQNYVNPSDLCLSQAWYLCVDMQLFIISPFIVLLIHKFEMKAIFAYFAIILASIGFTVASYVRNGFQFMAFTKGQFETVYIPTQYRFPSWLIGVIVGYFMFNIRNKSIHIPKMWNVFAWAISLTSMVGVIYVSYPFVQLQSEMSSLEFGLFDTLSRVVWAIALSYIVFACVHGYGGPINWFLSHPYFQPLNKLGYSMFLVHYPIIVWNLFTVKDEPFYSEQLLYNTFFATYMLSIFISILATLAFESPILVLQKCLLAPKNEPILNEKTAKIA